MKLKRRSIINWFFYGAGLLLLPVVTEFVIELAREIGIYENPSQKLNVVLNFLSFASAPWFLMLAVAVLFTGVGMFVDDRWRRIELGTKLPNDDKSLKQFGQELCTLSTEIRQFLMQRAASYTALRRGAKGLENSPDEWEARREFESETSAQLMAQYGGRIMGAFAKLSGLGVELHPHMIPSLRGERHSGSVSFFELMGGLLKDAHLAEAIKVSQDRNIMWSVAHI